jgi:plastocyanin
MRRSRVAAALIVVLLCAVMLVGACGSGSGSAGAGSGVITIHNFMFQPSRLIVKKGGTVTVRNTDDTQHTVTADDKSFDTGPIDGGKTATFPVTKSGTFRFHCDIHNYMTGAIQVMG